MDDIQLVWRGEDYLEQFHYGGLAHLLAVEGILTLAILSLHLAREGYAVFINRNAPVGVVKCEADPYEPVIAVLAVMEERLELVHPEGLGAIFAYRKHDGVQNIRLARAVWPSHGY